MTPLEKGLEDHGFFVIGDRGAGVSDVYKHPGTLRIASDINVTGFSTIVHRIGIKIIQHAH